MRRSDAFYSYFYLIFWTFFIGVCAYLAPYFANDYRYMLVEGTNDIVGSVSDIFISQYRHYFDWGGRTVAHLFAQFLLYIGKPYNAVFTALCYLALILGIYYHAYGLKPTLKNLRLFPLFFITAFLWICMRNFGEVVFNIVSSCNYLVTVVIILYFLLPYRLSFCKEKIDSGVLSVIGMFIFGIIAGWTNENNSAAACAGTFLICAYHYHEKKLALWELSGFIGLCLGFLILMLAPGNEARLDFMESGGFDYEAHLWVSLEIFFISFASQALLVIAFILIMIKIRAQCLYLASPYQYYASLWLILIGFISLAVMIASPNFPTRSAAPFTMFSIPGVLGLAVILYDRAETILPGAIRKVLMAAACLFIFATGTSTAVGYTQAYNDNLYRQEEIKAQLEAKQDKLVVSPLSIQSNKYIYLADVQHSEKYWTNLILKRYYNVKSIIRSCDFEKSSLPNEFLLFAKIGQTCSTEVKK